MVVVECVLAGRVGAGDGDTPETPDSSSWSKGHHGSFGGSFTSHFGLPRDIFFSFFNIYIKKIED